MKWLAVRTAERAFHYSAERSAVCARKITKYITSHSSLNSLLQGETCEDRVDQCALYSGTDIGCQNNGTCVNVDGGIE